MSDNKYIKHKLLYDWKYNYVGIDMSLRHSKYCHNNTGFLYVRM